MLQDISLISVALCSALKVQNCHQDCRIFAREEPCKGRVCSKIQSWL